ncbi:MAG: BREX-1 system adenine-specific DNA-methyltransferase PglX, partial [Proteobacteria bacterium]|nr:BREX-1 system adenine-specific DNA-methyltransferase PglX [Pseudomonadota bacterium]
REFLFEEMEEERAPLFSRKNLSVKGDIRQADVAQLIDLFEHGKTFGSLIRVPEKLAGKLSGIREWVVDVLAYGEMFGKAAAKAMAPLVEQAEMLARKYDAVVTNPPYMGGKGLNGLLKGFLKDNYADVKSDLFSAFIVRNTEVALPKGQLGFMSPFVWMFISSYEKLRSYLIDQKTLTSLVQLEYSGFDGATVPICTFTVENVHHPSFRGGYVRLSDFRGAENQGPKTLEAIKNPSCGWFYRASAADFKKIPGSPIAYWFSENAANNCDAYPSLGQFSEAKSGMSSCNSALFLRQWFEVSILRINRNARSHSDAQNSSAKWYPYNKGGGNRRWFGYSDVIINWANEGEEIKHFVTNNPLDPNTTHWSRRLFNLEYFFQEGLTWSAVTSGRFSCRLAHQGVIPGTGSKTLYDLMKTQKEMVFSLLNTTVAYYYLAVFSPTLNFEAGDVVKIPIIENIDAGKLSTEMLVSISKKDWDSYETSWDFTSLPLLNPDHRLPTLEATYAALRTHWQEMTLEIQRLEEENNRIFIEAYGVQDELTTEVPLEEITLTCNPHYRYGAGKSEEEYENLLLTDTIKEFISYAIGCMMGRYSLDTPGLIYAHSGNEHFWKIYCQKHDKQAPIHGNNNLSHSCDSWFLFPPDEDGIIPITDTDWFEDDAANRVVEFISLAWPKEHLEENLKFIADSLGPKRGESPWDMLRRYLFTGFYKHHLSMYKKRPIYWLFSSGKLRAFQCLVYLHRYNEGTLSRMRTEYVIPLQGKIDARIDQLREDISSATSTSHRKKLEKERDKLAKQQTELLAFDEKLRHYADKRISLDLDDGVKVNYGKFGDLLAEVKVVTGKKAK